MATIYHQVWINAPAGRVYAAASTREGIRRWWNGAQAETGSGLVFRYRPGPPPDQGIVRIRVVEIVQDRRVYWECISARPPSGAASAWTGTFVALDIAEPDTMVIRHGPRRFPDHPVTVLDFRHCGWDDNSSYLGFCTFEWGGVLRKLKQECEAPSAMARGATR